MARAGLRRYQLLIPELIQSVSVARSYYDRVGDGSSAGSSRSITSQAHTKNTPRGHLAVSAISVLWPLARCVWVGTLLTAIESFDIRPRD